MADQPDVEVPLHPVAVETLAEVVPVDDGASSVIPPPRFGQLERRLAAQREDQLLFVHLCVLHVRLHDRGLNAAADQLLALARIGLEPSEVERTLDQVERLRRAARSQRIADPSRPAITAGITLGVGLRSGSAVKLPGPRTPPRKPKKEPKP